MSWVFVGLVSVVSLASAARAAKVPAARSSTPPGYRHGGFKTPSGNIVCEYFFNYPVPDGGKQNFIRCGILSGLKPVPPRRSSCFDNGDVNKHVLLLWPTGAVEVPRCEGDIGPFALQKSARARLRWVLEWPRDVLHVRGHRADLSQQEQPRLLPQP